MTALGNGAASSVTTCLSDLDIDVDKQKCRNADDQNKNDNHE